MDDIKAAHSTVRAYPDSDKISDVMCYSFSIYHKLYYTFYHVPVQPRYKIV